MYTYREQFIDFFKDENIRSDLRELFKPFLNTIYNEMYTYILLFCIYNILLFVIILAIFYILINHILVKKPLLDI
tara:strand:- start:368 stop:592 length:225 start_codon:yes stop_codon:yes gene_type:complete